MKFAYSLAFCMMILTHAAPSRAESVGGQGGRSCESRLNDVTQQLSQQVSLDGKTIDKLTAALARQTRETQKWKTKYTSIQSNLATPRQQSSANSDKVPVVTQTVSDLNSQSENQAAPAPAAH